jgi:hypothetical protein
MKMKLIASLLLLCLTFSIGSALAQNKPINYPEGVILLNGNATGNYTISGQGGESANFTGYMLITANNETERVRIWDNKANTIVFDGKGPITPIKINGIPSQLQLTSEVGNFLIADLEDFKCNMTNLTVGGPGGNPATVNSTGPEMKVFGGRGDVNKFLDSNVDTTSECSLTYKTKFIDPTIIQQ